MARGTEIAGQAAAITVICEFLDCWQQGHGLHAWWPETICRREYDIGAVRQAGPRRPSWCYGTPGIVRAQQLAAIALGDQARAKLAEHSLTGCLSDPRQLCQLTDTTLCHGWAGTLLTACRVARDARGNVALHHALTRVRAALKNHLHGNGRPSTPGLLQGQAGVDLALASTATESPASTPWDACLLLAP